MSQPKKSDSVEKKPRSSKHSKHSKHSQNSSKVNLESPKSVIPPKEEINIEQKYQEIQLKDKICVTHQYPLSLFCETCEEPICQQCAIIGPHNSQLHRLNELTPAYIGRQAYIDEIIKSKLLVKREAMIAQIHRIEFRIEEMHYVKTLIERDARVEHSEIIQDLKSQEGNKLATLQNEMSVLQKDLDAINDIQQFFWKMTTQSAEPMAFLLQYQKIRQHLQTIVEKPFKTSIDANAKDLPKILTAKRLQYAEIDANNALLEFKDIVIYKLIEQTKEIQANRKNDMNESMNKEIQNWIKFIIYSDITSFLDQLKNLQKSFKNFHFVAIIVERFSKLKM